MRRFSPTDRLDGLGLKALEMAGCPPTREQIARARATDPELILGIADRIERTSPDAADRIGRLSPPELARLAHLERAST